MNGVLQGRSAIVTGASQGLGLAIASEFVRAGARVLICARDATALKAAKQQIAACGSAEQVVVETADVSQTSDAQRLVQSAIEKLGNVDTLVNNAGIYGPKGPIDEIDWDGWVKAIEVNLMGSVQMCRAILPHFKTRRFGRVIQLSGGGATNPLPNLSAYAASKAAVVRFAETLAEETRGSGITVNSIAPGALNTRLLDEIIQAGPDRVGRAFYEKSLKQKQEGGAPLVKAAQLAVFLASDDAADITGKLISAVWDPWHDFTRHASDLQKTDVYTLRRIGPTDRNLTWGAA